jgi:hypothetical protein
MMGAIMEKTIESQFFKAFEFGGVCDNCIDWIRVKHNLPAVKPTAGKTKPMQGRWTKIYDEALPNSIVEATKAFEVIASNCLYKHQSPLMDEIATNLDECKGTQADRYLYSLLKPFGESGCDVAKVLHPNAEIARLRSEIAKHEQDRGYWQSKVSELSDFSESAKYARGDANEDELSELSESTKRARESEEKRQMEACNDLIKQTNEQMDWVRYVSDQFVSLLNSDLIDVDGSVEACFWVYVRAINQFADRLDALLLSYGIDLLRLQKACGIWIKDHREITDVDYWIGSRELAQRYIDALPKPQPEEQDAQMNANKPQQGGVWLPDGLLTKPLRKRLKRVLSNLLKMGTGKAG